MWTLSQSDWCPYRKRKLRHKKQHQGFIEDRGQVHVRTQWGGGHPQATERHLRIDQTWLTLWSWTSSLQNCQKINFHCLSHPVCGILLWQPEQTNILPCPHASEKQMIHGLTDTLYNILASLKLCFWSENSWTAKELQWWADVYDIYWSSHVFHHPKAIGLT